MKWMPVLIVFAAVALAFSTTSPCRAELISVSVISGNDDAEESATGAPYLTSSDLELVFDGSNQTIGIRFVDLAIPKNAIINDARIQFTVDEVSTGPTDLTFRGELNANAATFANVTNTVSSRTPTTSFVNWNNVAPWATANVAGPDQQTPDLSSIVQEVVGLPDWDESSNALAFIITGTGERVAEAYNGSVAGAPLLTVDFSLAPPVTPEPESLVLLAVGLGGVVTWRYRTRRGTAAV